MNNNEAIVLLQDAADRGDAMLEMAQLAPTDARAIATLLKEQPEIIRCKECKHRPTYPIAYGAEINGKWCYWCELHKAWKHDDWYCADGERQEGR